jgi:uncharacterized protein (TIGR02145 family)
MFIKKVFAIAICVTIAGSCSTSSQMHKGNSNVTNQRDSLLVDRDGNKYPTKIFLDGNLWMTANLKLSIPGSYCYDNVERNCEQYGRLYTWESAVQGCSLLGAGWRLPTKDDWQRLAMLYGGKVEDSIVFRKEAYKALLITGSSGFNALLGGGCAPDSQYSRIDAHGFFWTATEGNSNTSWYYNFAKGSQALYQQNNGEKTRAFSVRCMKRLDGSGK